MIVEPDCWETHNQTKKNLSKTATRNQQHTFVNIYASTHTVYTVDMYIHTSKYAQADIFKNNTVGQSQQHSSTGISAFKPQRWLSCDFAAKLCP